MICCLTCGTLDVPLNALCVTLARWPCSSGLLAAFISSALIIFSVFSLAACSTIFWLSTLNLARADASSDVVRACLARSCHAMARSVRHCKASPSGSLTGSFCSDTRSERMVSRRGRRDRRHRGHKNLRSLAACMAANCEDLFFKFADLGNGTQVPGKWSFKKLSHTIPYFNPLKTYILWYMGSLVNLLIRDSFRISQTERGLKRGLTCIQRNFFH